MSTLRLNIMIPPIEDDQEDEQTLRVDFWLSRAARGRTLKEAAQALASAIGYALDHNDYYFSLADEVIEELRPS